MPELHRRIPVDPRVVDRIMRSPSMAAEQGGGFLQNSWGGPAGYQYWAKQPVGKRICYFAVMEGGSTTSEIAGMTDLSESEVDKWLGKLDQEGLVQLEKPA